MTDASEKIVVRALSSEMQRIKVRVPSSKWFFFGSITTSKRPVRDFDLLIVCKTASDCIAVRSELDLICTQFPIHLLIMTEREESEVNFIKDEEAIEMI
jgi:hypothetical protein